MRASLLIIALAACNAPASAIDGDAAAAAPDARPDARTIDGPAPRATLRVRALGVQGFVLEYGADAIMTAPLFTRQGAFEVTLNLPITADVAAIDDGLAGLDLAKVKAVISGHAHYDHFLDVPHVLERAPHAVAYTNLSGRHILAALAPDRAASCTSAAASTVIPRARVIAADDPIASHVDYTNCPAQRPEGAPIEGSWIEVPDSHVRMMPLCSMHPAQVGPYHFGEGAVASDQCDLPSAAAGWLEGQTLAYVIDFLDDAGVPAFRVFYQDAPTNAPLGEVPPAILGTTPVDLALLCVGANDSVDNEPTAIIENVRPRFVFSGHWEDFFQPRTAPPQPIPLLNVNSYVMRAEAALAGPPDAALVVDGAPLSTRHVLVQPGALLLVPARP